MKKNQISRAITATGKKIAASLVLASMLVFPFFAIAAPPDDVGSDANANNGNAKITICHATSSETNPYNTLHVSENATAGHFDENGTQLAGHELDLLINDPTAECPVTGDVTIIKNVVGGPLSADDFNLHLHRVDGNVEVANSPFPGSSAGTDFDNITAGFFYDVSEDTTTDYTATFSGDCNSNGRLTLRGGYDLTCTVTNTFTGTAAVSIDLAVDKTIDIANPQEGDTVVYTITVTNNGPDSATTTGLADNLPTGVTYVSSNTATGSYDNTTGDWTIGAMANGATATLTITATVDAGTLGDIITNTAAADADEVDSNLANNTDSVSLTVRAQGAPSIDLAVDKTVDDSTLTAGSNATFTITVTNNGPDAATNIVVGDLLPANLTFVSSVVSQGTYDSDTGDWTFASLASDATATLTIVATVNNGTAVGTVITNTAAADADESDSNLANNTDSADVTVISSGGGGGGNGGGGSSGSRRNNDDEGQVLGDTTGLPYVAPLVLGDTAPAAPDRGGAVLGDSTLPVTGFPLNVILLLLTIPAAIAFAMKRRMDALQ